MWSTTGRTGKEAIKGFGSEGGRIEMKLSDNEVYLIAAAPDLLFALKIVCGALEPSCLRPEDWAIARSAIAKAEGLAG